MKLNKSELLKALEIVKPALGSSEIVEQADSFAFIDGEVVTYNDEISIRHPLKEVILSGAIKAKELYALLQKIKEDEVVLHEKGETVVLKTKGTKATFRMKAEVTLPLDEIPEATEWSPIKEGFLDSLEFVNSCTSNKNDDGIFNCVHFHTDDTFEATDRFRIIKHHSGLQVEEPLLLENDSVKQVLKIQPSEFSISKGWVHFRNEIGTVLSCRAIDEKFPGTDKMFNIKGKQIEFPDETLDVLDRVSVMLLGQDKLEQGVLFEFAGKKLTINSEGEVGKITETIELPEENPEVSFNVTPYLLKAILKKQNTATFNEKALLFETDNWKYTTMLKG